MVVSAIDGSVDQFAIIRIECVRVTLRRTIDFRILVRADFNSIDVGKRLKQNLRERYPIKPQMPVTSTFMTSP